jgi:hypothetical protein
MLLLATTCSGSGRSCSAAAACSLKGYKYET